MSASIRTQVGERDKPPDRPPARAASSRWPGPQVRRLRSFSDITVLTLPQIMTSHGFRANETLTNELMNLLLLLLRRVRPNEMRPGGVGTRHM